MYEAGTIVVHRTSDGWRLMDLRDGRGKLGVPLIAGDG